MPGLIAVQTTPCSVSEPASSAHVLQFSKAAASPGFQLSDSESFATLLGQFNEASLERDEVGSLRQAEDSLVSRRPRRIHQKSERSTASLFCDITTIIRINHATRMNVIVLDPDCLKRKAN
jgi:hypothetical protein